MENSKKNLAGLMRLAHSITRAALRSAQPFKFDYRATLAAALRLAWSGSAAETWEAMDGEAQLDALLAMTWAAKRRDDGEEPKRQKMRWMRTRDDAQTVAADAWIVVTEFFAGQPETESETPLALILYRAVMRAAQKIDRAEKRNARALRYSQEYDEESEAFRPREYIDTEAGPMAERFTDPESAVIFRETLEAACADDTDRVILEAIGSGYTQAEAASILGMSQPAIAKRIRAIRARHADAAATA